MDEFLKVDLYQMVEDKDGALEARKMGRYLEEAHMKMQGNVKRKLAKYLEPLLQVPSADKYHW